VEPLLNFMGAIDAGVFDKEILIICCTTLMIVQFFVFYGKIRK
jgi:hypothetical protein